MPLKTINDGDIFKNTLITHPKYQFRIFKSEIKSKDGSIDNAFLYKLNLEAPEESSVEQVIDGLLWFDQEDGEHTGLLSLI